MSNNNQKNKTDEDVYTEIVVMDERTIRDRIYVVRVYILYWILNLLRFMDTPQQHSTCR